MANEKNASGGPAFRQPQNQSIDKTRVGFKVVDQNKRVLFKDQKPVQGIDSAEDLMGRYSFIKTAYMNWKGEDLPYVYDVFDIRAGPGSNHAHVNYQIPAWLSELLKSGQGGWEVGVEDEQGNVHLLDKNLRQLRDLGGFTLVLYHSTATADHGDAATAERSHEGTVRLHDAILDTIVFKLEQERGRDGYAGIPRYRSAYMPMSFQPSQFDGLSPEVLRLAQNLTRRRKPWEPPTPHRTLEGLNADTTTSSTRGWRHSLGSGQSDEERSNFEGERGWKIQRERTVEKAEQDEVGMNHPLHSLEVHWQPEGNALNSLQGIWNSNAGERQKAAAQRMAPVQQAPPTMMETPALVRAPGIGRTTNASSKITHSLTRNSPYVFSRAAQVKAETIRGAQALARLERGAVRNAAIEAPLHQMAPLENGIVHAPPTHVESALVSQIVQPSVAAPIATQSVPAISARVGHVKATVSSPKRAKLVANRRIRVRNKRKTSRKGARLVPIPAIRTTKKIARTPARLAVRITNGPRKTSKGRPSKKTKPSGADVKPGGRQ